MTDTVDTITLVDGVARRVIRITNQCDSTGESAVTKVDMSGLVSTNGLVPLAVDLDEVQFSIGGFNYVLLEWVHNANDEIAVLSGNGYFDYRPYGGLKDPVSTTTGDATNGDVVLTTDGNVDGNHYDITLSFRLRST